MRVPSPLFMKCGWCSRCLPSPCSQQPRCPLPSGWGFAHGARLAGFKFSGALSNSRAGGAGEFTGTGETCWRRNTTWMPVSALPAEGTLLLKPSEPVDKHVSSPSGFMFFLFEKTKPVGGSICRTGCWKLLFRIRSGCFGPPRGE